MLQQPPCQNQIDCDYCQHPGSLKCCPQWLRREWYSMAMPWWLSTAGDRNGFAIAFDQAWDYTDGRSAPMSSKMLSPKGFASEMEWVIDTTMKFLKDRTSPDKPVAGDLFWDGDYAEWRVVSAINDRQPYTGRPVLNDLWLVIASDGIEHCICWGNGSWETEDRPSKPHAQIPISDIF